jgi:DNA polymerase-3 subunit epsilon
MLHAIKESGVSIEEWLQKVERPISERKYDIERDGKEGAPLFGEIIVFTGALSVPRREAADIASNTGCEVDRDITKKTTILVVGDQDIERLRQGETKSSKHLKAEKLIKNGQPIRVINETSFWQLVEMYS